jgi:hypothetical protein
MPVSPALLPTGSGLGLRLGEAEAAPGLPDAVAEFEQRVVDETLYALGDGSDLPSIDVRADVAQDAEPRP